MGDFLKFLSDYYIYFLIAAGVLFFALIGLLVDLKKKRENTELVETSEEVSQEVSVPEPPVTAEAPVEEPVEDLNPAPPMPVEEAIPVSNEIDNSNVNAEISMPVGNEVSIPTPEVDNNQVLDSTPVMNLGTPNESIPVETTEPINTSEELK